MSNSFIPLEPVVITDRLLDVKSVDKVAVFRGGNTVTRRQFPPNGSSSGNISFNCPSPANNVITSRDVKLTIPFRVTINSLVKTTNVILNNDTSCINAGRDAPCSLPVANAIQSAQVTINGTPVSMEMSSMINTLNRFYVDPELRNREYSSSPCYPDKSYEFSDLVGTDLNPLGNYGSGSENTVTPRGGFPFVILAGTNTAVTPTLAGAPASATIDFVCSESLLMSPFYFSKNIDNEQGFFNISAFDFSFTMNTGGLASLWSHCPVVQTSGVEQITSEITSVTVQFDNFTGAPFSYPQNNRPSLALEYLTPNHLSEQMLNANTAITYPYYQPILKSTAIPAIPGSAGLVTVTSNAFSLTTIPDRLYAVVRPADSVYAVRSDIPRCYLRCNQVDLTWGAGQSLMTSTSPLQLYNIAVRNGLNMTYSEWSGAQVSNSYFYPDIHAKKFGTVGSIVCLEFGKDIQLTEDECAGMSGSSWQFQIKLQVENMCKSGAWDALPLQIDVITITAGTFTVTSLGGATTNLGNIIPQDILNAVSIPGIDYQSVSGGKRRGGNWMASIQDFATKVNEFLKESKAISKGSKALGLAGVPYASEIGNFADALGYGRGGGVIQNRPYGGAAISRNQLRR